MTIETKYNYNDKVFFLNNNKVVEGIIKKISILTDNTIEVRYRVSYDSYKFKSLKEEQVFNTKQELLDSL